MGEGFEDRWVDWYAFGVETAFDGLPNMTEAEFGFGGVETRRLWEAYMAGYRDGRSDTVRFGGLWRG